MLNRLLSPLALLALTTLTHNAAAVSSAELFRPEAEGFGRFEASVRYAPGDGIVSSFFLWKEGSEIDSVFWNELDFEKLGAGCELQTNSIFGLPQRNNDVHHEELPRLCDAYHTYTFEWTPDYIAWEVDGVEIRRDVGPDAAAYAENAADGLQFRFNVWQGDESFGGNFNAASLPSHQYVDWAQYSEYTPGAGDDGSDFTLKWREDFDKRPIGWGSGSWDSPLGLSEHRTRNVSFVDGIAVLSITADDDLGYDGTPPKDVPGDEGTSGGALDMTTGAGGMTDTSHDHQHVNNKQQGCSYFGKKQAPAKNALLAVIAFAAVGLLRRPLSVRSA